MFIDAVDKVGRRYMEVPVFREGSALRRASEDSEAERCIECGASVRHGVDAYYQRNDASDGIQGDGLESALMALTYDTVCWSCGQKAITAGAV